MNNEIEQILEPTAGPASTPNQANGGIGMTNTASSSPPLIITNVEDFANVCRTCTTITDLVIPIFSEEGLQNKLADKIQKHLPIQVREDDVLPRVLCYQCASTLLAWHELVECCVQADTAMRTKLIIQQPTTTDENSVNVGSNSSEEEERRRKFPDKTQWRVCEFCTSTHHHTMYKRHLTTMHENQVFTCNECGGIISKRQWVAHMKCHIEEHTKTIKLLSKLKQKKEEMTAKHNNNEARQETQPTQPDSAPTEQRPNSKIEVISLIDDFSDHSDTESGSQSLPEVRPVGSNTTEHSTDQHRIQQVRPAENHITEHSTDQDEIQQGHPVENNTTEHSIDQDEISTQPTLNTNDISKRVLRNRKIGILSAPAKEDSNATVEASVSNSAATGNKGKKSNKKSHTCPICAKVYKASSSYFYHMKYTHKRIKEHACEVCAKKFSTRLALSEHKAIHTKQYDFQCKQCQKMFKSKASLYIHKQTHSGKKSWACAQCQTSFRWKTHLLRHMKRHTAEKVHGCDTCGRGFVVRGDLLRHERTHSAGNYTCQHCGQKFAQLRYLKVHTKKKHSK